MFNVSSLLMYSSSGCFTGHGSPILLDLILAITLTDISSAANMLASTSIVSRAAGLGCPTHAHWHALLLKSSFWILSIEGSAKVDRHSLSQILTGCIWSNLVLEILIRLIMWMAFFFSSFFFCFNVRLSCTQLPTTHRGITTTNLYARIESCIYTYVDSFAIAEWRAVIKQTLSILLCIFGCQIVSNLYSFPYDFLHNSL